MATTGFSPITVLLSKVYGVSSIVTTLLVICYAIIFVLLNVPANMLIKAKGIAWPIRIASCFFISGIWVGMLVNHNFYFLLLGQCINACGMPFVQAIGATIAGVWFGDKERAQITNITSLASVIGVIIGFGLSAFFVDDNDIPQPEEAKVKVLRFILVQSSIITALSLPILFIVRKEPPTPPSRSAHAMRGHSKDKGLIDTRSSIISHKDFKTDMRTLLTSWNFWKLNLTFSFIYGVFNTLGAVTGVVNDKFGYSTTANSIFGATFVVSGIMGSFVHAFLLDKYNRYKLQYIII
jgi:FLVCR family feline leukemia virus subgroup C receptor-related protein